MERTLSAEERAIAGYRWLTTEDVAAEMGTSRQTVINEIRAGRFGAGNVTRWGREYRIRPEAFAAYQRRRAQELDAEIAAHADRGTGGAAA